MNMKNIQYLFLLLIIPLVSNCSKMLDEEVYSQLSPGNYLTTEEGITSILNASLASGYINGYDSHSVVDILNWCTDLEWETDGGENRTATLMINFTWDASTPWLSDVMWNRPYTAIRNANILLENVDNAKIDGARKAVYKAEARFIRALSYYRLYTWYGPVPLRVKTTDSLEFSRATDARMKEFLENELTEIAPLLPAPGTEAQYGRPTKGAALALLCKFYLNTKQWEKCASTAKAVMDLNYYQLYTVYKNMFKVENEKNREYIIVDPQHASGGGCNYMNGALPPAFAATVDSSIIKLSNWANWAAQYRLYDSFYNSFDPGDKRRECILTEYLNSNKQKVSLLNNNNIRSFKFYPDANAIGNEHGNDLPFIRYADILLSRAEALNQLNGPTQESIGLINDVRKRAGLTDIKLTDFTKETLNSHLLNERAWEFYGEAGIRREDQIRMGTFISSAIARGKANATEIRLFFPIPQTEINANKKLIQNPGY